MPDNSINICDNYVGSQQIQAVKFKCQNQQQTCNIKCPNALVNDESMLNIMCTGYTGVPLLGKHVVSSMNENSNFILSGVNCGVAHETVANAMANTSVFPTDATFSQYSSKHRKYSFKKVANSIESATVSSTEASLPCYNSNNRKYSFKAVANATENVSISSPDTILSNNYSKQSICQVTNTIPNINVSQIIRDHSGQIKAIVNYPNVVAEQNRNDLYTEAVKKKDESGPSQAEQGTTKFSSQNKETGMLTPRLKIPRLLSKAELNSVNTSRYAKCKKIESFPCTATSNSGPVAVVSCIEKNNDHLKLVKNNLPKIPVLHVSSTNCSQLSNDNSVIRKTDMSTRGTIIDIAEANGFSPMIVYFDLETTGLDYKSEIAQISCVSTHSSVSSDLTEFNVYTLPLCGINPNASAVNGLTKKGKKLLLHGKPVASVSLVAGLSLLLEWLRTLPEPPLLVGHNSRRFDAPRLLLALWNNNLMNQLQSSIYGFSDSLPVLRTLLPRRDGYRLESLVMELCPAGGTAADHNALHDCRALATLLLTVVAQQGETKSANGDGAGMAERKNLAIDGKNLVETSENSSSLHLVDHLLREMFSVQSVMEVLQKSWAAQRCMKKDGS